MANFNECVFTNATVVLDGNEYIGCKFSHCRIVVTRGNFVLKNSSFDGCKFEFGGEAANIKELIANLEENYPGIKERICDEKGQIRRFINIYVNEEDVRFLKQDETPLKDGDEVSIIPAIAGG